MVSDTHVKFTQCGLCEQKLKLHSGKNYRSYGAEILYGHYKWCLVTICKLSKPLGKILEKFYRNGYYNGYQNFKWP